MDVSASSLDNNCKKTSLDELSKEELIAKCKNLLAIAHKAKQSKDALLEKIEVLKSNQKDDDIANLTQQKVNLVIELEEAKNQYGKVRLKLEENEGRLNELDTKNQSLQRQNNRLSDENEQLLTHLGELEGKIDELKKIGMQQQNELLQLEDQSKQAENHVLSKEHEVSELQQMLSVSLDEVKKLKQEGQRLQSENRELNAESKSHLIIVDDLKTEIHKNRALNEKLQQDLEHLSKKLNENQIVSSGLNTDLENNNEKLRNKLKSYHTKMVKFAGDIKSLKESKNYILSAFKNYHDQVNTWKDQLVMATNQLTQDIADKEKEIASLKEKLECVGTSENLSLENKELKEKINDFVKKIAQLEDANTQKMDLNDKINQYEVELAQKDVRINELVASITLLQTDKDNDDAIAKHEKDLVEKDAQINELLAKIHKFEQESKRMNELNIEIDRFKLEVEKYSQESVEYNTKLNDLLNEKEKQRNEYEQVISRHENEIAEKESILKKHLDDLNSQNEKIISYQQEITENNQKLLGIASKHENDLKQLEIAHNDELAQKNLIINDLNNKLSEFDAQIVDFKTKVANYQQQLEDKLSEIANNNITIIENNRLIMELKKAIEHLENEVAQLKTIEAKLAEQSGEEILKLANENKQLNDKIDELNTKLEQYEEFNNLNDLEVLKRENAELLAEMNEMNQVLKERGETINKQQAYSEEVLKKIGVYEQQNNKNLEVIEEMQSELAQKNAEIDGLNATLALKCDDLANLQQNCDNLTRKISICDNTNESTQLHDELDSKNIEIGNLHTEIEHLRSEVAFLQNKSVNPVVDDNKNVEVVNRHDVEQLRAEIAALKLQCDDKQAELESVRNNDSIESLRDELTQKCSVISELETKLKAKHNEIESLQNELINLQDKLNNSDNNVDNDMLSTSTISKCDELARLKDLEGSWEERYGKLRTLAVKLKARIKELTSELQKEQESKTELQQRLAANIKLMQGENDKLQDELDRRQADNKALLDKIKVLNEDVLIMQDLRTQIDVLAKEKAGLDSWKKQVGVKVQSLKKELEANAIQKKEFEGRFTKLTADLESANKSLKDERDKHAQTRGLLHESNNECKKQSVLNLEMQDYERGIKDLSVKLESKQEQITKLKNQNDMQKNSLVTLNEQHRLLQETKIALENDLEGNLAEIITLKKSISDLEMMVADKEGKTQELVKLLEHARADNEELSTNLSQIISDNQKATMQVKSERDTIRNEYFALEQLFKENEVQLKQKEEELNSMVNDYQAYKVRAQSVLRQNQTRDVGLEEKLREESESLRAQVQLLKIEIDTLKSTIESTSSENNKLNESISKHESSKQDLQLKLSECYQEYEKLNNKYQNAVSEHTETVRSLKLHAETLSQCYRQQISEQEVRHNREIIELQSKLEKGNQPPDIPSLILPITAREEGEGSESVESTNGNIHPLEKLLGADQEQEINVIKKQLTDNESKVVHLTALLADTEQDLAKHVQMNKLLKEEIRRQQRSVEREKHAENLEYMKNVVFKFITLSSGDERLRLVPVLNTILKLSPEETEKLNMVAKGDRSWSNYLPIWSKPQ